MQFKTQRGEIKLDKLGKPILKEDALQKICFQWFFTQYGDWEKDSSSPRLTFRPNEIARNTNFGYQRKMKALGKKKGLPDLEAYNPKTGKTIFIELKASDITKLKNEQAYFQEYTNQHYERAFWCNTLEDFQEIIKNHLF